jgi:6-phosphofructokinase 1
MVALQAANIRTVALEEAIADLKTVPPESQMVRCARDLGVSFGAPDEERFHHGDECDQ